MAQPTITDVNRITNANAPYFQGFTDTQDNYDVGATENLNGGQGIRIYAVDAVSGSPTFTYKELMDALHAHADWSVTETAPSASDDPTRRFSISYTRSNNTGIICLRSGTLVHEIPGSTSIICGDQMWFPVCGAPAHVDNTGTNLEDVGVRYGHANTGGDTTEYTGRHEITLGTVHIRTPEYLFQLSNYPHSPNTTPNSGNRGQLRPVDQGFPQKVISSATPSAVQCTLGMFAMAEGQSVRITDNRLTVEFAWYGPAAAGEPRKRQDFDICGAGLIDAHFTVLKTSTQTGFVHNVATNPNNNIICNQYEDFTQGSETIRSEISGSFEAFSIQPSVSNHPYIDRDTRSNSPLTVFNRTYNQDGGKYNVALTGAGNYNTAANRNNLVLQAFPVTGIRYWQSQFGTTPVDVGWLDPPFTFTTTNTPFNRVESGSNGRRWQGYFCRSVAVNNRDAAGNAKNTEGWVVGIQKSASALANVSSSWMPVVIPPIRTHANGGTWSSRRVDKDAAGLEGVVGRGCHYLVDAAIADNTQGTAAGNYTRYSDSSASGNAGDNESYLIHRGGIHRYQTNQSLRSTNWNASSRGGSGVVYNNDVDDIPQVTDNLVNMFGDGLADGNPSAALTLAANGSGTTTLTGLSNLTQDEVTNMVGATLVGNTGRATITAATLVSATSVRLSITAASTGLGLITNRSANIIWDQHSGYRWLIGSDGNLTITLQSTTAITWTYPAVIALAQAKVEIIAAAKKAAHGTETRTFGTGNDSTYGSSTAINLNTLLERTLNTTSTSNDRSFAVRNTTTGTTVDVNRIIYSVPTGSSLTLNPTTDVNLLNYGSSYTVADRVTHNGAFTDSNGTPSFIDIELPAGVSTTDVKFSAVYQQFQPLTDVPATAFNTSGLAFDTNGTLLATEWQAVTRPSASGTDTILSTLPTSWDWTPSAAGSVQRIIVNGGLSTAQVSTLDTWADDTTIDRIVVLFATTTNWAIYKASEGSTEGTAVAMNLELLAYRGTPQSAGVQFWFGCNLSGGAVTLTQAGGPWVVGANPTITTVGTRNFVQVGGADAGGAETNMNGTWYFSVTGNKTVPIRNTYSGAVSETITLAVDPDVPPLSDVVAPTPSNTPSVVLYSIINPGSNNEVKTVETLSGDYPRVNFDLVNRMGYFINDYNTATDHARTRYDVAQAFNSTNVADYVARYGVASINDVVRASDVNMLDTHWRVRYDGVSQVDYLRVDGQLPTTSAIDVRYFEVDPVDSAARAFFNAPEFSEAAIQTIVQTVIDVSEADIIAATRRIVNNAN